MQLIPVSLGDRSYDVRIANGLLDAAAQHLSPYASGKPFAIVTDEHVAKAQWPRFLQSLETGGLTANLLVVPAGEASKSWTQLANVTDWLIEQGVERGDHVIALGGGVIGDLVGFACAILKRGCNFIQAPTTLLSQVDSSVGGKTAINSKAGKNLVGAFHQPSLVLIDPTSLDTLDRRAVAAGYAEVVKYGLIDDLPFFEWCEANGQSLLASNSEAREYAIGKSVAAKAAIVAQDERETSGMRALLNLGHTFGHALEAEHGFADTLLHGEAVAAGMALAFLYSARRGHCPPAEAKRVSAHLRSVGLPASLSEAGVAAAGRVLVGHMQHDKKMSGGALPFLLANGIGKTFLAKDVALDDVADFLDTSEARGERS